jgi:hypothetical protein
MLFLDDTGGDAAELVDDGSSVTKPKTESHSEKSARAHLASFARTYGASTALDLLKRNPSSSESRLSASFAAAVAAAGTHVKLVSFDLAREIAMHGDREAIARLLRVTEKDAERHGFWFDSTPAPPLSRTTSTTETTEKKHAQTGAFRVNCKDCLDRTNVAQAALAFRALNAQLRVNGFRPKMAFREGSRALRRTHGALWSAHGDDVARLYARTRALRRDVVGSGRTVGSRRARGRARRRDALVAEQVLRRPSAGRREVLHLGGERVHRLDKRKRAESRLARVSFRVCG